MRKWAKCKIHLWRVIQNVSNASRSWAKQYNHIFTLQDMNHLIKRVCFISSIASIPKSSDKVVHLFCLLDVLTFEIFETWRQRVVALASRVFTVVCTSLYCWSGWLESNDSKYHSYCSFMISSLMALNVFEFKSWKIKRQIHHVNRPNSSQIL